MSEKEIDFNYIYMFKNPIRFFLNIDKFDYQNIDNLNYSMEKINVRKIGTDWTKPTNFFIKKSIASKETRVLKFPNLVNFRVLYNFAKQDLEYKKFLNKKEKTYRIGDEKDRMYINLDLGDFDKGIYKKQIEKDLFSIVKFGRLYKIDINNFYDSIYTHKLKIDYEVILTSLNNGSTKGIILGNVISLIFAQKFLNKVILKFISENVNKNYKIEYFSDDIFIFTNNQNIDDLKNKITMNFSKYDLTLNFKKNKEFGYIDYNSSYILDKLWITIWNKFNAYIQKIENKNRVIFSELKKSNSSDIDEIYQKRKICLKFHFLNQLIYKHEQIEDESLKRSFIIGWFNNSHLFSREKYFKNNKLSEVDSHRLLYLIKLYPEILLYLAVIFKKFSIEFNDEFINILKEYYLESLNTMFYEEQVYYAFFLITFLKYDFNDDFLRKNSNYVLKAFLIKNGFLKNLCNNQESWILNYEITLSNSTLNIKEFEYKELISKWLVLNDKEKNKDSLYYEFFKKNLFDNKISLFKDTKDILKAIENYMIQKKVDYDYFDGLE